METESERECKVTRTTLNAAFETFGRRRHGPKAGVGDERQAGGTSCSAWNTSSFLLTMNLTRSNYRVKGNDALDPFQHMIGPRDAASCDGVIPNIM